MTHKLFYVIADTAAGWLGILGSEAGLLRMTLPRPRPDDILWRLGVGPEQGEESSRRFQSLVARLRAYFNGDRVGFPDRIDVSGATPFQREVWAAARLIPYGETRSYGWVAEKIGRPKAMRAVGQALGRNCLPLIVPCHRVLAGDGGLGGFSGGLAMKRFLLRLEGSDGGWNYSGEDNLAL
jgi:methylated-DNA-[protein]-cysteine S-methyltransferase